MAAPTLKLEKGAYALSITLRRRAGGARARRRRFLSLAYLNRFFQIASAGHCNAGAGLATEIRGSDLIRS